jgi:hypothetical protein
MCTISRWCGHLADAIIRESQNQQSWHQEVMQQLINTLITVVARNIFRSTTSANTVRNIRNKPCSNIFLRINCRSWQRVCITAINASMKLLLLAKRAIVATDYTDEHGSYICLLSVHIRVIRGNLFAQQKNHYYASQKISKTIR